ncbi:phosphate ABC transporter substrate-binding protein PstS [Streptomyces sp. RB6PN25]|uniref:Phosphate-binding protein n=1 Tax=Streptomyces humicola TaxID=2953240 RepID=A0ABT1Q3Y0_9ACTN|nr:phosphate ABC transporter substrate-binding protein PstS [Streptomyces humicola]MCQ4084629.1 phosphate ABC transporter substrate-binding protein PstS [Streptomyces humicola]
MGAATLCGALLLTACGSNGKSSPPPSPSGPSASGIACGKPETLLASGSTAQQNAMQVWVKDYMQACPGSKINYKGTGSGAGQTEFLQGSTAFAGSDSPLTSQQIAQSTGACSHGGHAIDLPMVGGPIAIGYNLPGVPNLTLDAPTLAKIFSSRITKWNDPQIAKLNPGAKLPSTTIQPFHRADASGTTDNFTSYLSAVAPSAWPYSHGKQWTATGGQSAVGSAGVTSQVRQTPGAIGYMELSYAISANLLLASIATGAQMPVYPNVMSASKALSNAKIVGTGDDLTLKLDYSTKAPEAYPIDLVTYEIVCDKGNKPNTWDTTRAFLTYVAGRQGQANLSFEGYAPLSAAILDKVRSAVDHLS